MRQKLNDSSYATAGRYLFCVVSVSGALGFEIRFEFGLSPSGSVRVEQRRQTVLFVCTHNSARSQMAEGLLRYSHGDRYDARSAGTEPGRVHPLTVRAMAEIGIDISGHASKSVDTFPDTEFDYVITVCDHAKETCPFFPGGKKHLHKSFPDPAAFRGSGKEGLEVFRRVRDEIKEWIEETFGRTQTHSAAVRGKERVQ